MDANGRFLPRGDSGTVYVVDIIAVDGDVLGATVRACLDALLDVPDFTVVDDDVAHVADMNSGTAGIMHETVPN